MTHIHEWLGVRSTGDHAYTPFVMYIRCKHCNAVGFRKPGSMVVYTWEQKEREN